MATVIFDYLLGKIRIENGSSGPQGPQGYQGEQGVQGPQGIPGGSLDWDGDWVTSTAYVLDDAVQNGTPKSSYRCIQAHTSSALTEPGVGANWTSYWTLFAGAGQQGFQGTQGTTGAVGSQGPQGYQGNDGADGDVGPQGHQGFQGTQGYQGNQGHQGTQGTTGVTGNQGPQGNTGSPGSTGPQGPQGYQGYQGYQGHQGAKGLNWRGDHTIGVSYSIDDAVYYDNSTWRCSTVHTGAGDKLPQVGSSYWDAVALKGAQGAQGNQGANGSNGSQGPQGYQGYQGVAGTGGAFAVAQTGHGLSAGNAIYHNGTNWQKAKADNSMTLATHIVITVADANNFTCAQSGRHTITSHGLTIGQFYFVSDATAGALTTVEPTTYSNPIIYVEDANTVHVLPFRASSGAGYGSVPIGSVFPFAGTVVPLGYLLADGSAVSRTTYSDLFNLIGTTYGTGDGSTTFNVPNLKGKVPVGYNSSETEFNVLGKTGGEKAHTLLDAEIPKHQHPGDGAGSNIYNETLTLGTGAISRNLLMLTSTSFQNAVIGEQASGDGSHNNLQPYIALNYIIKANTPTESTSGLGTGGWNEINAVVTRQSADDPTYVLRFNSDVTGLFSAGMRIKITQTTDKFFIVTAVGSYSGGNTDITVYGGTDYDVADTGTTAITKTYYSRDKAPKGFPLNPDKWSEKVTSTSNLSQSSPTSGTVYNLGSLSISGPVGVWDVYFQIAMQSGDDVTVSIEVFAGISTSASSFSDGEFKAYSYVAGSLNTIAPAFRRKIVTLTSKTTYYLVAQIIGTGVTNVQARGDASTTIICFTCAYL